MEGADGFGVGAVELLAALAAHPDEADVAQHAKMLGDRGLFEGRGQPRYRQRGVQFAAR